MRRHFIVFMLVLGILLTGGCSNRDVQTDSEGTKAIQAESESQIQSESHTQDESQLQSEGSVREETQKQESEPVITEINHYVIKADDRACMNEEMLSCFRKAVDAVFARKEEVRLTDSWDNNLIIMGALQNSPYSFVLDDFDLTDDHKSMYFEYGYSAEEQEEMYTYMDNEYLSILNEIISKDMGELEKVLAVYHYFASRISYNYSWLEGFDLSDEKYLYPDIEIYEALKTNQGVCHSYSYLCEFALQQLGVECLPVTGVMTDSDEGHMWLIVRIDGKYYHCDPTWDSGGEQVSLRYFGMTDDECRARGVDGFEISYDNMYGEIICDDSRFSKWRDVYDYHLNGDHTITLYRDSAEPETEILQ